MSLELAVHQVGTTVILQATGSICETDVYRFSQAIRDMVKNGTGAVGIDVTKIEFMESHALGIVVSHFSMLNRQGRELFLINSSSNPNSYITSLLEASRINEMIRVVNNG